MIAPLLAIWGRTAVAVLACVAGSTGFFLIGAPAPWLTGAALAGAIAALAGAPPKVPPALLEAALLVLGCSLGAAIGPDSLNALWRWPLSILALIVTVPLIVGTAQALLVHGFGWERREATLAAVPGALAYCLAVAASERLDVRKIAIAQSVRLMTIVLLVPVLFRETAGLRPLSVLGAEGANWHGVTLLLGLGLAGGLALKRLGAPAALMLGGMLMSCIAHVSGLVTSPVPGWLLAPAVVMIGANVGSRFAGSSLNELGAMLAPSLAAVLATFATSALAGAATAYLLGLPMLQTLLAFAPGGLDTIAVLVLTLKLDAAFVTVHQLVRFLSIAAGLPVVFRLLPAEAAPVVAEARSVDVYADLP